MALLDGMNHLASMTNDLHRLATFYAEVFDVPVIAELEEEGLRHAMLQVGTNTVLHAFEIVDAPAPPGPDPMFERGRLDHFGLNASSEAAFHELRRRAVVAGASNGEIVDFGPAWSFSFTDPDGNENEIVWTKPDRTWDTMLRRTQWPPRTAWPDVPVDG